VALPVTITVGEQAAKVTSAVMKTAGVDWISFMVPTSLGPGDVEVIATVAGVPSQRGAMLTIGGSVIQ